VAAGALENVTVPDGMRIAQCESVRDAVRSALPKIQLPGPRN